MSATSDASRPRECRSGNSAGDFNLGRFRRAGVALRPPADHYRCVLGFGLGGPLCLRHVLSARRAAQSVVVNNQQTVYGPSPATYPAAAPVVERIKVIIYRPAGCDSQTQTVPSKDADQQITILRC